MSNRRRPLSDRVLVKPDEKPKDEGYNTGEEKPSTGVVIDVGRGKNGSQMEVIVGDRVQFNKGAGIEISLDGEDYLIMEESRILMIL